MKIFYMTKEFIQNELGIKNVVTANSPVCIINGQPTVAKVFEWDNINECKGSDLIKDTVALGGVVVLYQLNEEAIKNYEEMFGDEIVHYYNDADKIVARLYQTN